MAKTKGVGLINCKNYLLETYGQAGYDQVLAALSPDDRAVLQKPIVTASWVDYGVYLRWMLTADKVLGKGDFAVVHEINRYSARKDTGGIYKFLLRIISTETIISNAAGAWRQFYDTGKFAVVVKEHHRFVFEVTEFPDIPLHHDQENSPYLDELLRLCGGRNTKVTHPKCIARGDASCIWEMKWE